VPIIDYNNAAAGVKANHNSRCSPAKAKSMPAGRVCATEDCETVLSIYNRDDLCGPCAFSRGKRRSRGERIRN
jgi:hypothetical protein